MTFAHWLKSRLLPANTHRGRLARQLFHRLTPWRPYGRSSDMLDALAASQVDVRFVQVGSNDAGYGDPLSFHTLHHGWRGLMIEPLPHIFERLCKRYANVPGLQFANVAIDREPGERPFYHLRRSDEPGLPPWYDMLGSFKRDNVLKHAAYLADIPERIVETNVRCQTFAGLCAEHNIERFDVLHIDAEGYDYEVLRTVELRRYAPALVLYERMHLSPQDQTAGLKQLHDAGYQTHDDPVDTVAVSRDALARHPRLARTWARIRRDCRAAVDADHSGADGRS